MRTKRFFDRRRVALLLCAAALMCAAAPALAQSHDQQEGKPFLEILFAGAEWPGTIIVLLSLTAVTIIAEHFWAIREGTMTPQEEIEATRKLIEARRFKECVDYVRNRRSMFADLMMAGLRHGRHGFAAMYDAVDERANTWTSRLFRRVEYLNIIGNLSPLMGLLGTVLGMIRAFSAMQDAHGAYKPENLAGGISLALVNTFLGLAVAIIALGFFGICRNRVDAKTVAAHAAALDLLEYFRPSSSSSNGGAAADNNTSAK